MNRALLLILLCSCGPRATLVSAKGTQIFFKDPDVSWTQETVDEQESWFVDRLDLLGTRYTRQDVEKTLKTLEADVYTQPIQCGSASKTGLCNGLQNYNVLLVRDMGCVASSAYTHEMLHWLQQSLHHETDYDHTEPDVWSIADGSPHGCTP